MRGESNKLLSAIE